MLIQSICKILKSNIMPSFPKPKFTYNFNLNQELNHLQSHKEKRKIPEKSNNKLLMATWNIANLGLQNRWQDHYTLIAEILSWFDIITIEEVNDNLEGLRAIEAELPSYYELDFSDKAGNNERTAFVYDGRKIKRLEMIGEVSVPPKDYKYIKIDDITTQFNGFDRNPYLATFSFMQFNFMLIGVHIFFGSEEKKDVDRRALETFALARYAYLRRKSKHAYMKNIIAMGDFNLPKVEKGDPIYDALTKKGLRLPNHSTKVYSNINNDKQYDQIAFFPGLKSKITAHGVFDFDSEIFPDLWQESTSKFRSYLRYYMSDHRPMWMQLDVV